MRFSWLPAIFSAFLAVSAGPASAWIAGNFGSYAKADYNVRVFVEGEDGCWADEKWLDRFARDHLAGSGYSVSERSLYRLHVSTDAIRAHERCHSFVIVSLEKAVDLDGVAGWYVFGFRKLAAITEDDMTQFVRGEIVNLVDEMNQAR